MSPIYTKSGGEISISDLRASFNGFIITPGDPDYDAARTIFYGGIDRRPAVILCPKNTTEVAKVISLARGSGLELAVHGGGHSAAGHGITDGGIVLDLAHMKALDIDPERRTAWAEAGLTAGEYTTAAAAYGLATGFGDTASVGIGGLTLGGGVGFLVRKHGLTIDNLLAAEMVTADGEFRYVDASSHPDLFWAIRGGGGNFGVVTRFKFQLHAVDVILGGMLLLPATPEVIAGFIEVAESAPEDLSTIANVMPAPSMPFIPPENHGQLILLALLVYAGDIAVGEEALAPFRALATPIADMIRPMQYPEMFMPVGEDYHPTAVGHTMFMDTFNKVEAQTIVGYLEVSDAPMRVAQLRVLGGAAARVPVEATAYAHRERRMMVNLAAFYNGDEDRTARQTWVKDFAADLSQGDSAAYVNFIGDEGEARVRDAYPGAVWDRLAAIKARYDPTNLFRLNQNIRPAND